MVLALLGLLAGVVVFAVGAANTRSATAACEADRRVLEVAVESYRARTGYLPSNQGILVSVFLDAPSDKWNYHPPVDLQVGHASYSPSPECQP